MKKIFIIIAIALTAFNANSQLNITYQGSLSYNQDLNDIWGYVAPNDDEYALVGVYNGVSIVELSDPTNPTELFFMNGVNSTWRDIKVWGEFAYVTNESSNGVMVIDLSNLPFAATSYDWTPNIPGLGTLSSCHNIYIDELGYAYLVGCNLNNGGMLYIDVSTTPGTPVFVDAGPAVYAHDVYVRNNLAYSSEIYAGQFAIYNVTDKSNSILLGSQNTAFNFTHNAWLSDDGNILFTTDEVSNASVGSYDVSDPTNIIELDQFQPFQTLGSGVIPHNVHVWQDWLIISYYTDGCILVDGSNPNNLIEVGNFDTFIPMSSGFSGAWGAYPFLPSGLILISDIGNGLYVLAPTYVHACWLEGNITDAMNQNPLGGAEITIEATNVFDQSAVTGTYSTGYAVPGTYDVTVTKAGYNSSTQSAELINGVTTVLDFELTAMSNFSVSGSIIDAVSSLPIPNAMVRMTSELFNFDVVADANGNFDLATVFEADYEITAGKWGYITSCENIVLSELNNTVTISLDPGIYDDFTFDFGWTNTSTASTGDWERGEPIGTNFQGNDINPGADVNNDCSTFAYVTGNGGGQAGSDDVDDGIVELVSPPFSGLNSPVLNYSRWFANFGGQGDPDDMLNIYITDGLNEVLLESLDANSNANNWTETSFSLYDFIDPAPNYQLILITGDDSNSGHLVEAGLDLLSVDYTISGTGEIALENIIVFPNPSNSSLNLNVPENLNNVELAIYNLQGQLLITNQLTNGNNSIGRNFSNGTYLLRFTDLDSGRNIQKPWVITQ